MAAQFYTQSQLSVAEQLEYLKSEGMAFADERRATHLLQNISLFRLKSYMKPFRLGENRQFKAGATFEAAYRLYKFDSELRRLICAELEKIEVSFRTQLSLIMSDIGGTYWYADTTNFRDVNRHAALLNSIRGELNRSDEEAFAKFHHDYANPFPPSWMTFEVTSFGTLSMIYKCLRAGHVRRRFAGFYGLSDTVMESWLHSIVYVRNICAHHSRLWNRKLSVNPVVPRRTYLPFVSTPGDTKRVYYVLSILLYFLQTVNPQNTFAIRLCTLLDRYPQVDISAMGIPMDWRSQPLWMK